MKNLWKSLFVAALMVSCSEANVEENPAPEMQQGQAIEFYADMGGRTSFFEDEGLGVHWVAGDKLAIRRWYGESNPTSTTRQRSTYRAAQSGATTTFTWVEEDQYTGDTQISWVEGEANHVTAYYPTTANAGAHSIGNITLPSEQVQSEAGNYDHLGDYMIMSAEPQTFAADALPTSVGFQLTNLLSIVEVTLKGDATKSVAALEMMSTSSSPLAFAKGTLNATKSPTKDAYSELMTISTGLSSVKLSLTTPAPLSAEGAKFYFVVLPGTHAEGEIVLNITFTDGSYSEISMDRIEFKMNQVYRPIITLTTSDYQTFESAELEIVGENAATYFGSVNFENGSTLFYDRTTWGDHTSTFYTWNIPYTFHYTPEHTWQTLLSDIRPFPDQVVKTKTSGYVYVVIGTNATLTENLLSSGWVAVTGSDEIFYGTNNTSSSGKFVIYQKYYEAGVILNFTDDIGYTVPASNPPFQGIRPLAKKITWPLAKVVLTETQDMKDIGGTLTEFKEGARIATSYAQTISTTWNKDDDTKTKSIPAGYVGMKMYTVNRKTKEPYLSSLVVSGVTQSAGWVYQVCPEQAWDLLKADGWKRVEYCILTGGNDIDFYIVGKWFESGATVATLDYTETLTAKASALQYFNTGILLGDLSIAE